jgi:hypothetical protein
MADNHPLPQTVSLEELSLGVGVYLFFKNYCFHSVVFVMMGLLYSIFAMITNVEIYDRFKTDYINNSDLLPIGAGSKILCQNTFKN